MGKKILTLTDEYEWRSMLDRLPASLQDVYYLPEYYGLFESSTTKAECFTFWEGDSFILYPYLKTDVREVISLEMKDRYYDIEGAYGYNGFVGNSNSEEFLTSFAREFSNHCIENNIIAEFTRFNPLSDNHLLARHLEKRIVNQNVIVDLSLSEEELWSNSYEHASRKNVNKARRSGLTVAAFHGAEIRKEWIDNFYEIYLSTMDRNAADPSYYWKKSFFYDISHHLRDNSIFLFATTSDGKPVSAEVILLSRNHAYSYLGGTLSEHYPKRPNNILKHEGILLLKKMGIKKFCLGGGTIPDDGIFKYKQTFAKNGAVDFFIGMKVHNVQVYERLCKKWMEMFPEKAEKYAKYLLKYRY